MRRPRGSEAARGSHIARSLWALTPRCHWGFGQRGAGHTRRSVRTPAETWRPAASARSSSSSCADMSSSATASKRMLWIDPIVESAGNPKLLRGSPNVIEAGRAGSRCAQRCPPALQTTGQLGDRPSARQPGTNTLDPANIPTVYRQYRCRTCPDVPLRWLHSSRPTGRRF